MPAIEPTSPSSDSGEQRERARGAGRRPSLTVQLGVAALVSAVIVAVAVGVLLHSVAKLRDSTQAATSSEQVLNSLDRLLTTALDMETGERGYVITDQPSFLQPYERSRTLIGSDSRDLESRLAHDPTELASARTLAGEVSSFNTQYAEPVIALMTRDPAAARTVALTRDGKTRMDQIRAHTNSIFDVEGALQIKRQAAARASARHARVVGVIVLALLLVMIAALAAIMHRAVVRPLRRLLTGVETLAGGDLDYQVPQEGASEVSRVGVAVNWLAASLSSSQRELHERNAELAAVAERNLLLLDSVYDQAPLGLAFLDSQLRFVRVNEALAAITRRPAADHVGRPLEEFVADRPGGLRELVRRVVSTGQPVYNHEHVEHGPPLRAFSVDVYPVRQEGRLLGVGIAMIDVTERRLAAVQRERALTAERQAHERTERGRRRAAFLAEASAVLDASLDLEATLSAFSRLAVPRVADWCAVDVLDDAGRLRNVAVAHADPDRVELALEFQRRYPPDPSAPVGAARVVRTGEAELYETVTEEMLSAAATDEEQFMFARGLGMTSVMIVPMIARGRTLGAITFVAADGDRHFDREDLAEATELGRRAALAVDTARLYRQRAETARVLQMSLLPPQLPVIENVELAARFRAAGEGALMGGDFYDVFATGPGTWAIVIGDVCGKGAPAAAVTALARYTLRALASRPLTPSQALQGLNDTVLRQLEDGRFLTMVYVALDLRGPLPVLRAGCAGHPPPILVPARGAAQPLSASGTLLGVVEELGLKESETQLAPGDAVVLYSDGVTEADRSDLLTPERLAEQLRPAPTADALARAVDDVASRAGVDLMDDVAIVALRYDPQMRARRAPDGADARAQTPALPARRS